jgi:hypothetical protein
VKVGDVVGYVVSPVTVVGCVVGYGVPPHSLVSDTSVDPAVHIQVPLGTFAAITSASPHEPGLMFSHLSSGRDSPFLFTL